MILRSFNIQGEHRGYHVWCPGCKMLHGFYTSGDGPCWDFDGNMESPTFRPSLRVMWNHGPERVKHVCHSFVRNGQWQFLNDCTHNLAGQTVPMESIPS